MNTTNDIRDIFSSPFLKASDLQGDTTAVIMKIEPIELGFGRQKKTKPLIWLEGFEKGFVCNAGNADLIADQHGTYNPERLIGKQITLFATTTKMMKGNPPQMRDVKCIRVRPRGYSPRIAPVANANGNGHSNRPGGQNQKANPFPAATQADQLIADEEFKKELDHAFADIGFQESHIQTFLDHLCRTMNIDNVYALNPGQRTDLVNKLRGGRYDRFKTPVKVNAA